MDKYTFNNIKKRALHAKKVHKKFKDDSFKFDKKLMKELFDDSKLDEEGDEHDNNDNSKFNSKVRIGKDYQVTSLPEPRVTKVASYTNVKILFVTIFFFALYFF
jgi:hypothetical protein